MEATQKFWKFASTSNATDTLENIFIKWAAKEQITINEFNSIYSAVNEQINEYFDKTANIRIDSDGSVSGPAEEVQQYIEKLQQQQNNLPQESNFNDENATTDAPIDPSDLATPDPTEGIAQQPMENESNVGQEDFKDESVAHVGEDINASPSNENTKEDNIFPLLGILRS